MLSEMELVAVIMFIRASYEDLKILHLAVKRKTVLSDGDHQTGITAALLNELGTIARQINGISRIGLPYGVGRISVGRFPVRISSSIPNASDGALTSAENLRSELLRSCQRPSPIPLPFAR